MSDDHAGERNEPVRLQKVLAAAGLGSRRACEELIAAGRVEVDGRIVIELGTRVDPDQAVIRVDGSRLPTRSGMTYLVLNKPRGVVSTMNDPEGRPCVGDYVRDRKERLFHVGRLDTDTEGLILLTNDGELANRLSHPRYGVSKIYFADVPGPLPRDLSRTLKAGVELDDGVAKADKFRQIGAAGGRAQVEVEIHEGRNHIVRRMLEAVGHPVSRLVRVQIGPVNMGNLAPGRMRHLTTHEVSALLTASESDAPPRKKPAPATRTGKKPDPAKKNVGSPAVRKAAAAKKAAAQKTPAQKTPAKRTPAPGSRRSRG
jgi:pseudouridine synthase